MMVFNDLESRYSFIEKLDLNIAPSLNQVFWNSLGIGTFEVEAHMGGYEKLLKQSIHVCETDLTPTFADAMKCHQAAIDLFDRGEYKEAAALMVEVEKMSNKLSKTYEGLNTSFSAFAKDISEALVSLEDNYSQISSKKERLVIQKLKDGETTATLEQILKSGMNSLDDAIKLLWKINLVLMKTSSFWNKASFDSLLMLCDPMLSDEDCLQLMGPEEATLDEFDELVEIMFNQQSASPVIILTLKNNQIKESSLNWSALAKANDLMASQMKIALNGIAIHSMDIAIKKQDSLLSALM